MRSTTRGLTLALLLCLGASARAAADASMTPEMQADILRLMEKTGAKALGQQMGQAMAQQMIESIRAVRPDIPDKAAQIVNEVVAEQLKDSALWDRLVPIYARYFSHEEIK